jgi:hypothetical protein
MLGKRNVRKKMEVVAVKEMLALTRGVKPSWFHSLFGTKKERRLTAFELHGFMKN